MKSNEDRIAQLSELSDYTGSALSLCKEYIDGLYATKQAIHDLGGEVSPALLNKILRANMVRDHLENVSQIVRTDYNTEVGL